ncbi:MAG: hypothetical protein PHE17_05355 [Thiothrix sp.]|uniref:hypothetical protein n=1 Tax=Thiothrix sp. TaxID=1032 RepID=UPI00262279EF|nr:hypothetical protein [Thiothrix sp.]MDD5392429.1 hypothetical protein [Thiothrix sp.]
MQPETVYRWARIGWDANVSARVWEATERSVSLEQLIDEGKKLGGGITGKKLEMVRMIDAGKSCYAIAAKLRMQPSRVMQAAFVRGASFVCGNAA